MFAAAGLAVVLAAALAPVTLAVPSAAPATCLVTEGAFTWGFKESFRAYVSGSIANGEWTTEGGIDYATPAFSSDELVGALQLDGMTGELAVDGAMRFTGHDGILDTTISDPRLLFDGPDQLVMVVNVTGTTQDFVEVSAVDVPFLTGELSTADWRVEGDTLVIDAIALELTAEGADAFGTYPEGEPFDPLTLELDANADCAADAIDARAATTVPVGLITVG
ncbi:MAG: HtaA domain-containing protein, partial [Microcella sp.]|nr:HtaA domain-containing protein [Microcella sp.]